MFKASLSNRSHVLLPAMFAIASLVGSSPAAAQTAAPTEAPSQQKAVDKLVRATSRQQAWLNATPEQRILLAEELGEEGARTIARQKGWQPVFDGTARVLPQGPDQVWRSADDVVHVIEAKGGGSPLGHAYGHPQGSPEWAVKSAQRVLRSSKASAAEQQAARTVLEAAARGRLQVHVVRTSHVLGEPTAAVLQRSLSCTDEATRLAGSALDDLTRAAAGSAVDAGRAPTVIDDAANSLDDVARAGEGVASSGTRSALRAVGRIAVPVAVVVDGAFRVHEGVGIEERFGAGEITEQEREIEHARNAAGMAGGWGGALVGAKLGAIGGGAAGSAVAPGPGTAIGGVAGGLVGGVAGYVGGEAAAEAAAEWTVEQVHATGTTIADVAGTAWDGTKRGATATAGAAGQAWDWTKDTAGSTWDTVAGGAGGAWHWLAD